MEFYYLKFIIQFCLVIWAINFIVGYPLVNWLSGKRKPLIGWSQIFGVAIILVLTSFTFYAGIFSYVKVYYLFFISIMLIISSLLILKRKDRIEHIRALVFCEVKNVFITVMIMVVFLFPQQSLLPYIPSYGINHDAIGMIMVARLADEKNNFSTYCVNQTNPLPCHLYFLNYPLGFSLFLAFFKNFFKTIDFYNLSPLINLYLFSITAIPLTSLARRLFKKRRLRDVVVFLSLIAFLPVQYVNQSSYGQVTLSFLLFSSVYLIIMLFDSEEYRWDLMLGLGLLLGGSIYVYSMTIFFWLTFFIPSVVIYKVLSKTISGKMAVKKLLIIAVILGIFSSAYLMKSISLYKNMAINYKGTDLSFFEAKGNSMGYASLTTAFSTWLDTDFRIDYAGKLQTYAYVFLFIQLGLVLSVLVTKTLVERNNVWLLLSVVFTFVIPVVVGAYVLKSPYYYDKTLFYASFVFSLIIYSSIFLVMTGKHKNVFIYIVSIGVLVVMLNNSIKSLNWFGTPPMDKFKSINEAVGFLDNAKIGEVVAIDNDDWLKYFLTNHGACVTYAPSFPCGLEDISLDKYSNLKLAVNHIYMIEKKYQDKIVKLSSVKMLYENSYYKIVKY